jgi:NAD(P)-dependent dehydrogenase (short-subunit alcohol dehydrogenase family)
MVLERVAATLDGSVAVVTGGGAGIGRGVAAGLAAFGARVAIWERDEAAAQAEKFAAMVPMGRMGHVDEMAGAAVFLASGLSSYVTGQTIHVDGGTAAAGGWYHDPGDGHHILGPPGGTGAGDGS